MCNNIQWIMFLFYKCYKSPGFKSKNVHVTEAAYLHIQYMVRENNKDYNIVTFNYISRILLYAHWSLPKLFILYLLWLTFNVKRKPRLTYHADRNAIWSIIHDIRTNSSFDYLISNVKGIRSSIAVNNSK